MSGNSINNFHGMQTEKDYKSRCSREGKFERIYDDVLKFVYISLTVTLTTSIVYVMLFENCCKNNEIFCILNVS